MSIQNTFNLKRFLVVIFHTCKVLNTNILHIKFWNKKMERLCRVILKMTSTYLKLALFFAASASHKISLLNNEVESWRSWCSDTFYRLPQFTLQLNSSRCYNGLNHTAKEQSRETAHSLKSQAAHLKHEYTIKLKTILIMCISHSDVNFWVANPLDMLKSITRVA